MIMTDRKERAADHLLLVARQVLQRLKDGYVPTFKQIDHLEGAIRAFDIDLICGHKVIEECDCAEHG